MDPTMCHDRHPVTKAQEQGIRHTRGGRGSLTRIRDSQLLAFSLDLC
jgi:hypothetical protein